MEIRNTTKIGTNTINLAFYSIDSFYKGDETKRRKYFQNGDTAPHRMSWKQNKNLHSLKQEGAQHKSNYYFINLIYLRLGL